LYFPFTKFIYESLSCKERWWHNYFHETKKDVFPEYRIPRLSKKGSLEEIRENYDELALFKLIPHEKVKAVFVSRFSIVTLSGELYIVRNDWAHRYQKIDMQKKPLDYLWAERALERMIKLSELIKCIDTKDEISILLDKLRIDRDNPKRKFICTPADLKKYLEKEVFSVNYDALEKPNKGISDDDIAFAKDKIKNSRNHLRNIHSNDGIVAFFWNAIIYKGRAYTIIKDCGGRTFEDVRDIFDEKCYGNKK